MADNKDLEALQDEEAMKDLDETAETADAGPGGGEASGEDTLTGEEQAEVKKAEFADLVSSPGDSLKNNLDLLMDVSVPITVVLGHSTMKIEEVLQLAPGSVIELDKRADEPVDLKVNEKLVARGEIVVVGDYFGIRVSEIVEPAEVEA